MNIYELLEANQAPTYFAKSPEQIYYNENSYRLNELESYFYLANPSDSFGVVRGNIILRALENKETIESLFKEYKRMEGKTNITLDEFMKNGMLSLPYLKFKGNKVFVPVFPLSVANVYSDRFERLSEMPYKRIFRQYEAALIDPFDYYGYDIFISYFTRLVLIKKDEDVAAFYDYDARAIYFTNNEGRLDSKLCLFDKGLKHPVLTKLMPRVSTVIDAYFENDKEKMLKALYEGELISASLLQKIRRMDEKKILIMHKKGGEKLI